jgi:hypothetical protein
MKIKFKLLQNIFQKFCQTNLNANSSMNIPFKTWFNVLKIILYIDSKLLEDFCIWPATNNTLLFDYNTTSYSICIFDIHKDEFSMCLRKSNGVNILVDKEKFSIKIIKEYLKEFKQ